LTATATSSTDFQETDKAFGFLKRDSVLGRLTNFIRFKKKNILR
jgi:hypothetical protein